MFQGKTTIVVGAGGSQEFGMPLGNELTEKIQTAVNIPFGETNRPKNWAFDIQDALSQDAKEKYGTRDITPYEPACKAIVAGMREAPSIDEFIHQRRNDKHIELVGKLGIVYCILNEESGTHLYYEIKHVDDTIRFAQVQQTWLANLRRFLTDGCTVNQVPDRLKKVCLIVFNYDRCVEQYLVHSLQNTYTMERDDAVTLSNFLEIIHPYGVVGKLPWQGGTTTIPYGETTLRHRLLPLTNGIRTFTEQARDTDTQDYIRQTMQDSQLILFYGFAFHRQNLDLLTPKDRSKGMANVIGTAMGISNADLPVVQHDLARRFSGGQEKAVELRNDLECYALSCDYKHKFSI